MHPDAPVSSSAGYIVPHWAHLKLVDVFDPVGVSFRLGDLSFRSTFIPPRCRDMISGALRLN
jgi:hypothetical protein